MSEGHHGRVTRPEPQRTAPHRQAVRSGAGASSYQGAASAPPPHAGAAMHQQSAHAVSLGYQVIDSNIRQGRDTAERIAAGQYGPRDVPQDLQQLGGRLVQLTRDLGVTWFELIGAVLRDPTLRGALQRPAADGQADHQGWGTGLAGTVPLTCALKTRAHAIVRLASLRHPEQHAALSISGLHSPDKATRPITKIHFIPSADGQGITAVIDIPDDQAPGIYTGAVCDARTHYPLGTLTVEVMR